MEYEYAADKLRGLVAYYYAYSGTLVMSLHDQEEELQRWFDDYKVDRNAYILKYEWLVVSEHSYSVRRRKIKVYEGEIGSDHNITTRKVKFDVGCPPPPSFMMPAKEKRERPFKPIPQSAPEFIMYRDLLRQKIDASMCIPDYYLLRQPRFVFYQIISENDLIVEYQKYSANRALVGPISKPVAVKPTPPKYRRNT